MTKEITGNLIPEDIEFDVVVRMPPVKEQIVLVRVRGTEKATPHVVEPEKI